MLRLALLLVLAPTGTTLALSPPEPGGAPWSPERTVGPPDAQPGDHVNAWATLAADGGAEWLQLEYARVVPVAEVRIHENHNPGAVAKVTAVDDEGGETVLWEGVEPKRTEPNVFVVKARPAKARRIRIHLDTQRVQGWNEIDAVELVALDGTRQWATGASASSTYASAAVGAEDPLQSLVGKKVRITLTGRTIEGVLRHATGDFLKVEVGTGSLLVGKGAVQTIEW